MNYTSLKKEVLACIVPSAQERKETLGKVRAFLKALNTRLKKKKVPAKAVLGGSYAKDTWLSGDYDVDIFVKFSPKVKDSLSDLLEKALVQWNPQRIHGSRDYFWVKDSVKYEIVPVLDIKKAAAAQNVTDFSPLHVAWVNSKGKKFKNDIRLVKKFCKVAKCYGAESYIRGFSGHVVDILTIHYKGFAGLLKAAVKWTPKQVIDTKNVHRGKALLMLNKSKTEGPLVVVDPVQPDRNAAAAFTQENFDRFVAAAKAFLKRPEKTFFEEKEMDFAKLAKKGHLVEIKVQTLDEKEDVAGTKFVRAFECVIKELTPFTVKNAGWEWDKKSKGIWWFILKEKELPKLMDWKGPPLKIVPAVKKFKSIYKKTFTKQGRVWAKIQRKERAPKDVLNRVLSEEFVKSRVLRAVQR
ncbi:MAG TPA: nucleotidyltransferase domain-containing protein [Candidatus Nanoarchaeia archaeon]|nr:nucleotidyltransferase domain-containing protein [Candidatus Nanoarchaeia archaeon]